MNKRLTYCKSVQKVLKKQKTLVEIAQKDHNIMWL